MTIYVRHGLTADNWSLANNGYVKVDSSWIPIDQSYFNGGTWTSLSVPVPNLVGLSPAQADAAIAAAQLVIGATGSGFTSNSSLDNKVGTQTVAAGTLVVPGSALGYTFTTFLATPATPTLSYLGSTGRFTISNYNSAFTYTVTSGTRSGSTLTLPSNSSTANVSAVSFSGGSSSASRTYQNKPFAYSCRTIPGGQSCQTCCIVPGYCYCGPPGPSGGCEGGSSPNGQCGCGGSVPCMYGTISCQQTGSCNCVTIPDSQVCDVLISETGNGFTNGGSEWYKIT